MRIKIKDLSKDFRVSVDELELIRGGDAASDLRKRAEEAADRLSSSCWLSIAQCMSSLMGVACCGIGTELGSTGNATKPKAVSVLDGVYRREL